MKLVVKKGKRGVLDCGSVCALIDSLIADIMPRKRPKGKKMLYQGQDKTTEGGKTHILEKILAWLAGGTKKREETLLLVYPHPFSTNCRRERGKARIRGEHTLVMADGFFRGGGIGEDLEITNCKKEEEKERKRVWVTSKYHQFSVSTSTRNWGIV